MVPIADPIQCKHTNTRLTYRPDKNGNTRYQRQCLECWQQVGNWISKLSASKEEPLEEIPVFNDKMKEQAWANRQQQLQTRVDSQLLQMRPIYEEYLKSSEWHKKRDLIFKRANGLCEGCGIQHATQVHHFSYGNLGNEFLWELAAVCDRCHDNAHPWKTDNHPKSEASRLQLYRELEKSPLIGNSRKSFK